MKIVCVSNIKGGTGKSTITANLAVSLSSFGKKVVVLDIDYPQFSLMNYFRHRSKDAKNQLDIQKIDDIKVLPEIIEDYRKQEYDYCIVDFPGKMDSAMDWLYVMSDVVVTPLHDSEIDLGVIGKFDQKNKSFVPGCFGELIWEMRKKKFIEKKGQSKWIIVPNRLGVRITNNQRNVLNQLKQMQSAMNFELCSGIKDRVVFKELCAIGMTVFDLEKSELNTSRVAARNEIRSLANKIM
ncbi:MAG: AAA family ATPase [Alphaproteobacteria bacterium]|nr:MAG: AAA family ATPase [Alphaproteobacteria bacterium]